MRKLSIITPCYYNQDNLPVTLPVLEALQKDLPPDFLIEYVLIDDGSKDETWSAIQAWKQAHPERVVAIKLSGNFGSYNAIMAGMAHATGDVNVIISADLQDPPELILQMVEYWQQGHKFIVAYRTDRQESLSQKLFSNIYHALMRRYAMKNIPPGGFDFVCFDQQLRKQVVEMRENHTNSIYLLAWLKYPFVAIPYVRRKRDIGKSRWTLRKKIKLFVDSFVSFTYMPVRAISLGGVFTAVMAVIYGLVVLVNQLQENVPIQGWSSLMLVLLFVSAFQMIALGVLGEYLWRTLDAARGRPAYIIDEVQKPENPGNQGATTDRQ